MILVHYKDGTTKKFYLDREIDLCALDKPSTLKLITRLAILDGNGHRVDLPVTRNGTSRVWFERVKKNQEFRGERIFMRRGNHILSITLYYSDGRIVVDL